MFCNNYYWSSQIGEWLHRMWQEKCKILSFHMYMVRLTSYWAHQELGYEDRHGVNSTYPHFVTIHPTTSSHCHSSTPHRAQNTATHVVTTTLRRWWGQGHWWRCVWRLALLAPTWTPPHVSVSPAIVVVGRMLGVLGPCRMSTEHMVVWSVTVCSLTWKGTRSVNVYMPLLFLLTH